MAGKSREELLREIAGSTPTGGGNNLRDGRYRLAVRKMALGDGHNGPRWDFDAVVVACAKVQVIELKTGKPLDIEPNAVGTDVGLVNMLTAPGKNYKAPGLGAAKDLVCALMDLPVSSITEAELFKYLDSIDAGNIAYGYVIDCVTRRKVSKENQVEMTLQDWYHVPNQTDEDAAKMQKWMEGLVVAAPVAQPAAPQAPQMGPPAFGPPAKA